MTKHPEEKKGELLMILKVILESVVPAGAAYGARFLPQIEYLAIITLVSSLLFFGTTIYYKELNQLFIPKHFTSLLAYTILVAVIPYGVIFYATKYSTAIDSALLIQSEIIYAAIFGYLVLKEKMDLNKVLGISLILLADILILFKGTIAFSAANIALLIAPVSYVFGNSIAKKLQRESMGFSPLLLFRQFVGGLILLGISLAFEPMTAPHLGMWPFLIVFGLLAFGVSKLLWQLALHRMDLSKVTALLGASPIAATLIAFLWLKEIPTFFQLAAVVISVLGVALLYKSTSKQWVDEAVS